MSGWVGGRLIARALEVRRAREDWLVMVSAVVWGSMMRRLSRLEWVAWGGRGIVTGRWAPVGVS